MALLGVALDAGAGAPADGPMAARQCIRENRIGGPLWLGLLGGWIPRPGLAAVEATKCRSLRVASLAHGALRIHLAHPRFNWLILGPADDPEAGDAPEAPTAR